MRRSPVRVPRVAPRGVRPARRNESSAAPRVAQLDHPVHGSWGAQVAPDGSLTIYQFHATGWREAGQTRLDGRGRAAALPSGVPHDVFVALLAQLGVQPPFTGPLYPTPSARVLAAAQALAAKTQHGAQPTTLEETSDGRFRVRAEDLRGGVRVADVGADGATGPWVEMTEEQAEDGDWLAVVDLRRRTGPPVTSVRTSRPPSSAPTPRPAPAAPPAPPREEGFEFPADYRPELSPVDDGKTPNEGEAGELRVYLVDGAGRTFLDAALREFAGIRADPRAPGPRGVFREAVWKGLRGLRREHRLGARDGFSRATLESVVDDLLGLMANGEFDMVDRPVMFELVGFLTDGEGRPLLERVIPRLDEFVRLGWDLSTSYRARAELVPVVEMGVRLYRRRARMDPGMGFNAVTRAAAVDELLRQYVQGELVRPTARPPRSARAPSAPAAPWFSATVQVRGKVVEGSVAGPPQRGAQRGKLDGTKRAALALTEALAEVAASTGGRLRPPPTVTARSGDVVGAVTVRSEAAADAAQKLLASLRAKGASVSAASVAPVASATPAPATTPARRGATADPAGARTAPSTTLSPAVLQALQAATIQGNAVTLPPLDRTVYLEADLVLRTLGCAWNRGKKAHLCANDKARDALQRVLGEGRITTAADLGFFATPPALAAELVAHAGLTRGQRVLEPSAGTGAIVAPLLATGATVVAVEFDPDRARALGAALASPKLTVTTGDFLALRPEAYKPFDAVVMNPPFALQGQRQADIEHVEHALRFLAPGGRLVAVMSSGTASRSNKQATAFRARIEALGGRFAPIPEGTFKGAGTTIGTLLLTLTLPEKSAAGPGRARRSSS